MELKDGKLEGRSIRLRLATEDDAAFIHGIRSDPERTRFLSAIDPEVATQARWLRGYKEREARGEEYYFIIEQASGAPVGTVRVYDFRGESFSWGSWLIVPGTPPAVAMESALLVYEFAFGALGFARCHFEVRKGNDRVIAFHTRFGARDAGEDEASRQFTYSRADYEALRPRYAKFLPPAV
jgi:RimJ/RimL family protein N-acetyltransferase